MKRLLISLLLAAAGTARAALPRVSLDAPLAPVSAPGAAAAPSLNAPLPLSMAGTLPSAAAALAPTPALSPLPALPPAASAALAARAAAPAAAPALPELPIPDHGSVLPRNAGRAEQPLRLIDRLVRHAADSRALADGGLETAAPALRRNFAAAAGLERDGDDGGAVTPPAASAGGEERRDDLLGRLLTRVTLDDNSSPEQRAGLEDAFRRMLTAPSARALAERYLAEGAPAVVRFERFEGSRIYDVDGRKIFYAPRAFTEWKGDHVEVRVNLDYLGTDAEFLKQDLPPILAHELLGHGLWYSRAVRENALQAFHHHELNETNARLVGWAVDFELDGRFEESGAWNYLQDPAGFLAHLKLRLPYYALTFSNEELARPVEALEARSAAAKEKRAQLEAELANLLSWNPVIEHFVKHHGLAESRLRALRAYMSDNEAGYREELKVMDALIADVDATVGRMKAEPDRVSERYLQWAAAHPMFADLARETEANGRRLIEMVGAASAKAGDESAEAALRRDEHWRGQVTFDELVELYRRDRERNPSHWSR